MTTTTPRFVPVQRLPTSGARAVEPFRIGGAQYLAVAQLSIDVPGQAAHLNAGDSDSTPLLIQRWTGAGFEPHQQLPVPGGEDAEFFRIGERAFLATASLRTGRGPYLLDSQSVLYEWRDDDGRFEPFQTFATFAAKQWRHFQIDGRHFLALAQGVVMEGVRAVHAARSCIFEWDGERFSELQTIESGWGYNWKYTQVAGRHLLAYADQVAPSRVLEWNGRRFEELQTLQGKGGRAFCFFEREGDTFMAFANMLGDSLLYRWAGDRFEARQAYCGPGARELLWLPQSGGRLLQTNFVTGSREAPKLLAQSHLYRFGNGGLEQAGMLETSGAVDAASFSDQGMTYVVIANSLNSELRFRSDSVVYRVEETIE